MADTYSTIAQIVDTTAFSERLTACAAQQGSTDPTKWVWTNRYQLASTPSWAEKVDYWRAANPEAPDDGWAIDQAVISDSDILAAIQPLLNPPPPPEPEYPEDPEQLPFEDSQ